jgi:hypothetical protein
MTTDERRAGSTRARARLATIDLPAFGMPSEEPRLPDRHYAARLERLRERMDAHGYERLVVYADREHSAFSNMPAYLPPFLLRPDRAMTVAR